MQTQRLAGMLLCATLVSGAAMAEPADEKARSGWPGTVGVSLDASVLLGIGLSVGVPLGDRFNLRLSHHAYSYDKEFDDANSGASYDGTLDLKSTGLLADWHPFKGVFRLTAGLMSNGNQIKLVGTDSGGGQYAVGDCTYESSITPGQEFRIDGVVDFKSSVPYLGLGWGGNMNAEPGFYGIFDLGVMFSGAPRSNLKGSGSARNTEGNIACGDGTDHDVSSYQPFQDAVSQAEADSNEETKNFKLWPNIGFGIGWRF